MDAVVDETLALGVCPEGDATVAPAGLFECASPVLFPSKYGTPKSVRLVEACSDGNEVVAGGDGGPATPTGEVISPLFVDAPLLRLNPNAKLPSLLPVFEVVLP